MKQRTTLLLVALLIGLTGYSQKKISSKNYRIYSFKDKKEISLKQLVKDMADVDLLIYGESHNDSVTHYLEHKIYEMMIKKYDSVAVSMEMFNSEVQSVVDEYVNGIIKEHHFTEDANAWSNYKDYRPMVELAKKKALKVIAANAPFRYVSLANKGGQEALMKIDECHRNALAPIPYDTATGEEYKFLMTLMHGGQGDTTKPLPYFRINQGQSLWNATMAYSIAQYHKSHPAWKIFQVNGRFHSDNGFGIIGQLPNYAPDLTYKTISAFSDKSFPDTDYSQFEGQADYIIITDPEVPTTYD